jgi:hypothetical protein
MTTSDQTGVDLAGGRSATHHLHQVLAGTQERFADTFGDIDLGATSAEFKGRYPDALPRFEAARVASPKRSEIAAALIDATRSAIVWHDSDGEHGLGEYIAGSAEPFELESSPATTAGRLVPRVPLRGHDLSGDELVAEVQDLVDRGSATPDVAAAIEWIVGASAGDGIDLTGRRIAVLGAAAELAPTRMWLEGGADVLWIDLEDPPTDLLADDHPGSLCWVAGGADLLNDPARIRATIEQFAGDDAVDLGLYGYAGGRAREWRLAAAMNAIVDALIARVVRGAAMLVSPTTCGVLTAADLEGEARRLRERPRWQSALARMRAFGSGGGHATHGEAHTNRAIVSIQGSSYQAAQYLGKLIAAEAWVSGESPIEVSANTAGISPTESLHHPVFDTAFSGAAALGVETFDPETTAHLNGLLTLHDRLTADQRTAGRAEALDQLSATRVHGGIYEVPYPIDPALRVAAGLGVAKDPRRIVGLLKR